MPVTLVNSHKYTSGAKVKGYIRNNNSGDKKLFYFNPSELSYSRSATYQEFSSPGLNYPMFSYVKGNSSNFSVPLKIIDKPRTGLIQEWEDFLNAFLPPTENNGIYTKPDELTFVMGTFICECILESLDTAYEDFDEDLYPIECTLTLNLRRV